MVRRAPRQVSGSLTRPDLSCGTTFLPEDLTFAPLVLSLLRGPRVRIPIPPSGESGANRNWPAGTSLSSAEAVRAPSSTGGTEGSNPPPSSKESGANLVSSMTARRSRKRHRNSKRVWTSWRGRLARQVSQPTSNDHRSEGSKGAPPGRTIPAWRHGLTASESATCACCHPHQR
jgi:hypothetical protein